MAIPTYVGAGTIGEGADGVTVGMPASLQEDDLLILQIEGEGEDANADPAPTGGEWTLIGTSGQTGGDVRDTRVTLYYHVYNGTDDPNLSVPDAGNHTLAVIAAFRGVDTSDPVDVSNTDTEAATTTHTADGPTTTVDDTLVCIFGAIGNNVNPFSWANGNLSDVTEQYDETTTEGSNGGLFLATGGLASAGAVGGTTFSTTGSLQTATITVALQEPQSSTKTGGGAGVVSVVGAAAGTKLGTDDIELVGTGVVSEGSNIVGTTGLTMGLPSGVVQNDFLLMISMRHGNTGDFNTPAGWTRVTAIDGTSSSGEPRQAGVFYRYAGTTPPGSFTLTHTDIGADKWSGAIVVFRNVHLTSPFSVTPSASHYGEYTNKSLTNDDAYESITPIHNGAQIVVYDMITHDDLTGSGITLSGYTNLVSLFGGAKDGRQLLIWTKNKTTAGAESPGTSPYVSDNTQGDSTQATLALRPAVAGSGSATGFPGEPTVGFIYWGASIGFPAGTGNSDPARHETPTGEILSIRRTFFQSNDDDNDASVLAAGDLAAGRLPWISYKLPYTWAQAAAGNADAWFDARFENLAALDGPAWMTVHHEPEDNINGISSGSMSISAWKGMQVKARESLDRSGATNVAFAPVFMGSTFNTSQTYPSPPGGIRDPEDWWEPDAGWDFIGIDHYHKNAGYMTDVFANQWQGIVDWVASKGLKMGFAEWGTSEPPGPGDDPQEDRIQHFWDLAIQSQTDADIPIIIAQAYYDSNTSGNVDWLLEGDGLAKFQEIMSDPNVAYWTANPTTALHQVQAAASVSVVGAGSGKPTHKGSAAGVVAVVATAGGVNVGNVPDYAAIRRTQLGYYGLW